MSNIIKGDMVHLEILGVSTYGTILGITDGIARVNYIHPVTREYTTEPKSIELLIKIGRP